MKRPKMATAKRNGAEKSITDQAAEWLAALSDESCSADERCRFGQWLTRSNLHVHEFLRVSALMRQLQRNKSWPAIDVEALINDHHRESEVVELIARDKDQAQDPARCEAVSVFGSSAMTGLSAQFLNMRAAAVLAVLVAAAIIAIQVPVWLNARQTYSTALGELRSIALEDGSIIELNSQSKLRSRFTAHERLVELTSGEAVFKVTKDPARPFRVRTHFADAVAVGTQFDVKAQANQTVVTVIEGRVAVSPQEIASAAQDTTIPVGSRNALQTTVAAVMRGRRNVLLSAGEQVVVQPSRSMSKIARVDPVKATGWTLRRLYFEDTPLATAASEFARYSPEVIRINDESLGERRISGTFDSSDPGALVHFMERYGDTSVTRIEHGWILEREVHSPSQ